MRPCSRVPLFGSLVLCLACASLAQTQPQLQISAPTDGSIVNPGQTVSVTVISPAGTAMTSAGLIGEDPIGFSNFASAVPAQFSILLPVGIACRPYMLTAVGVTASGVTVQSDPIHIDVERQDMPAALSSQFQSYIFEAQGQTDPMMLLATFSDGSVLDVTQSTNVTYQSANSNVATVDASGTTTALEPGSTSITVTYNNSNGPNLQLSIPITVLTPALTFSPAAPNLGNVNIGGTSNLAVTVVNATASDSSLGIKNVSASGDFSEIDNCVSSSPLGAGGSCTIQLTFAPAAVGSRSGTLTVTNSASSIPSAIALTGVGVEPVQQTPVITWAAPAAITYGTALSGSQLNATANSNGTSVEGTFAYNPPAGTVLGAGSFTLSVSFAPTDTTDFTIATATAQINVNPAPLTLTASSTSRSYGSVNPPFTFTATGLVDGDTLAAIGVTPTCGTTATASSPAGNYPITCSGPLSAANYLINYHPGALTIVPVPLTIIANNTTKILNAPNAAFTTTYSGFVNGDTPASLAGTLNCTSTAATNSPVGSYPINCSGQSSNNYVITYVPGALNVVYAGGGVCDGSPGHQILPPINADGSSVYNQGRTVPAQFRVCDANGISIGTVGTVSSFYLTQIVTGTVATTVQDIVNTNNPDAAFRWDPTDMQWIFNVGTQGLSGGSTYVYTINLNDGTNIMFQYGLK